MRRRQGGLIMYVARFSYDVLPVNRQQALDFIRRELQAAQQSGLTARILVPLTRGQGGGGALQFEVELANLDQLDQFRNPAQFTTVSASYCVPSARRTPVTRSPAVIRSTTTLAPQMTLAPWRSRAADSTACA